MKAGDRIGPYEVIGAAEPLDIEYDYVQASFGAEVVLLKLVEVKGNHDDYVSMWLGELGLHQALVHPNIARVVDVGRTPTHMYSVQEIAPGTSVHHLIGKLSIEIAIALAVEVCVGLHYAHEFRNLEIVHRRLTPRAIMVGHDGSVKIHELGTSQMPRRKDPPRLTEKLRYLSPAQARGKPVDRRSDVYSLGAIIWEMTVGKSRIESKDPVEIMQAIGMHDAVPPSAHKRDYPRELERVVMRALERDPKKRFATADELREELVAFTTVTSRDAVAAFLRGTNN